MSDMSFNRYQELAEKTAIFPEEFKVVYPTLGLAGETGEVVDKIKKLIRDYNFPKEKKIPTAVWIGIQAELGDVLWYLAMVASDLNMSLDTIARVNISKLKSRKERGKIKGDGDAR